MTQNLTLRPEENAMLSLRALYVSYGYTPFKMTKFEEYDLYVRNKNFLLSDHIITFTDTDGKLMALKPDVTLSIVKNSKDTPDLRHKVYYSENVYRVSDKSGSYREIMQTGLECIGDVDTYCLSEVLTLAVKSLETLSPDSILAVSDLDLVSEAVALTGASYPAQKKLLTCVGEKNRHGIDEILKDEGIDPAAGSLLKALLSVSGTPSEAFAALSSLNLPASMQALTERFAALLRLVPQERVRIDFSTVSDFRYYNGVVFKGFVKNIPTDILSGGQYDKLMQKMGRESKAVGFAVYLDLLEDLNRTRRDYDYDTVVLYNDESDPFTVAQTVETLTQKGERVTAVKKLPQGIFRHTVVVEKSEVKTLV